VHLLLYEKALDVTDAERLNSNRAGELESMNKAAPVPIAAASTFPVSSVRVKGRRNLFQLSADHGEGYWVARHEPEASCSNGCFSLRNLIKIDHAPRVENLDDGRIRIVARRLHNSPVLVVRLVLWEVLLIFWSCPWPRVLSRC
jgi:hypothetical protein